MRRFDRLNPMILATLAVAVLTALPIAAQEVVVIGELEEAIDWLESEGWWGEEKRGQQLHVPHALITGISPRWRETAKHIPVAEKKEIFYRFMLPLVLHANTMVLDRRARLASAWTKRSPAVGNSPSADDTEWLRKVAADLLRIGSEETDPRRCVTRIERSCVR